MLGWCTMSGPLMPSHSSLPSAECHVLVAPLKFAWYRPPTRYLYFALASGAVLLTWCRAAQRSAVVDLLVHVRLAVCTLDVRPANEPRIL